MVDRNMALVWFAIARLHFYRADIAAVRDSQTPLEFMQRNWKVIQRIIYESHSQFGSTIHDDALQYAVQAYLAPGRSVEGTEHNTLPYKSPDRYLAMKVTDVFSMERLLQAGTTHSVATRLRNFVYGSTDSRNPTLREFLELYPRRNDLLGFKAPNFGIKCLTAMISVLKKVGVPVQDYE